ncbi:hypothetical protein SDC9_191393 [bioreactor metagenome]|uniref:Uncharacterized protein n=1 Tax=bioreactor metagenome TaxID=1076179 RepID=A0A645HZC2_9ZZZZ
MDKQGVCSLATCGFIKNRIKGVYAIDVGSKL